MISETVLVKELKDTRTQSKAFELLIDTYKERLYWHVRRIVLNHDDADDVLQNTFIKVFRSIHNFKEESKLYSWMYRIATNEAISFLNNKRKKLGITSEVLQDKMIDSLEADVYFEGNAIELALQKAIAELPEKQRLVFQMKYFQAMKYETISEVLDTSVGALKASYHLAVKKIETHLTQS